MENTKNFNDINLNYIMFFVTYTNIFTSDKNFNFFFTERSTNIFF